MKKQWQKIVEGKKHKGKIGDKINTTLWFYLSAILLMVDGGST